MTQPDIQSILDRGALPDDGPYSVMETHISWVLLSHQYAYKIKKPVQFSFLDFSTLDKRKHFCEEEVRLNSRLSPDLYLGTEPVADSPEGPVVEGDGTVIDYAVKMKRLHSSKRMDKVLEHGGGTDEHVQKLAHQIADFHEAAEVVYPKLEESQMIAVFNDLGNIRPIIQTRLGNFSANIIDRCLSCGDQFLHRHMDLMQRRMDKGLYRNCHGDLHSRNIFLYPDPVIFDCIDFNPSLRNIDLLNEIAFFVMDLEFHHRKDLASTFLETYLKRIPLIEDEEDGRLFTFYKLYRANVRAKVNGYEAMQSHDERIIQRHVHVAEQYLKLVGDYLAVL